MPVFGKSRTRRLYRRGIARPRSEMRSTGAIKRATRVARRYLPDDLREVEQLGLPQVAFIIELVDHLPSHLPVGTAKF